MVLAHRAGAAAPRRRASSAWWCPRTSRSRAPGSPACTSSTSSGRRARARWSAAHGPARIDGAIEPGDGVGPPDRRQRDPARRVGEGGRLHVGGVEARAREPQDPPRARACGVSATCVRVPGLRRPRDVASTCSSRAPLPRAEAVELLDAAPGVQLVDGGDGAPHAARGRRHRPRARRPAARGPVAGATPSTSGSPATTCARARRSTRSSSPSYSSSV